MIINPVEVIEFDDVIKIQSLVEYSGKRKNLWYSFPKKFRPYLTTDKLDGFLVGLLLLAMKLGEDIRVEGAISEKLHFNLTHSYINIMKIVMPNLKKIKIKVQDFDNGKNAKCEGAVVTGFSAGVDSFCTVYDHCINVSSPSYKITHFVFNNVGSHGEWDSEKARKLFNLRHNLIKGYPENSGIELIKIDSNLSDILQMNFQQTHVPRNVSAVLLLQKLFSKYYYASTYQYKDCVVKPYQDIAIIDPLCLHLLSTETLECISSGCEYSRVEKTRKVAKVPFANRWLNVCVNSVDGTNCSACLKCCRTLLTLEVLGLLENFSYVFNLKKWQKVRNSYLRRHLADKNDPFIKEILEYAKNVGYSFKPWTVVASKLFQCRSVVPGTPLLNLHEKLRAQDFF